MGKMGLSKQSHHLFAAEKGDLSPSVTYRFYICVCSVSRERSHLGHACRLKRACLHQSYHVPVKKGFVFHFFGTVIIWGSKFEAARWQHGGSTPGCIAHGVCTVCSAQTAFTGQIRTCIQTWHWDSWFNAASSEGTHTHSDKNTTTVVFVHLWGPHSLYTV